MAVDLFSRWAVLDTETSGLSPGSSRVLSLAVVTLDASLRVEEEFYTLLDPGVDPGPVEVHGLTREVLAGAPQFQDVLTRLNELTRGRVVVAHNAGFDMGFLKMEADLVGRALEHGAVVDTVRTARKLEPGLSSYSLSSLAAHHGVIQRRAHDALDDTKVLVEVFKALHAQALASGAEVLAMGERTKPVRTARVPGANAGVLNPGKLSSGGVLLLGMRVAFTGGEVLLREALEERAVRAGLVLSSNVSGRTSVLVEGHGGGAKGAKARQAGCPVVTYAEFVALLSALEVRSGSAGA
jgi:DNA polymerase-3 subunit epsilon